MKLIRIYGFKVIRTYIFFAIPFALLIIFASLLTTKPYLNMSKGLYESHDDVFFDHDYAIDRIIGYLNYEYEDLAFGLDEDDNTVILRQIEIDHMVDVKNLYTTLRLTAGISLIIAVLLLVFMRKKDELEFYNTLKNIYFGPLFFTMFIGGYLLIDFNTAFTKFHQLFFTNDDWILYSTDVLIILLPTNFWMVSGLIILVLFSSSIASIVYINDKIHKTLSK
ncbi:MAG: DUF1461 domain-containing protein [Candidatus Izemoplasma sp.]